MFFPSDLVSIDPSKVCEPFCWLLSDEIRVLLSLMKVIHSYRGLPQMKNHIVDFFRNLQLPKVCKDRVRTRSSLLEENEKSTSEIKKVQVKNVFELISTWLRALRCVSQDYCAEFTNHGSEDKSYLADISPREIEMER
mmetsp:Transcript_3830/g.7511  ORF Transcript_3830/g.7511 Transcript_3830/m.7511 type:complete len:138 (+) Transcript_3830:673-1086(+)